MSLWVHPIDTTGFSATRRGGVNIPSIGGTAGPHSFRRPPRYIVAIPGSATFTSVGDAAPTLAGTAAALRNADGDLVQLTNTTTPGNVSGVTIATFTRRQYSPSVVFTFSTALLNSRVFVGLADADASGASPAATDAASIVDFVTAGRKVVGLMYDKYVDVPRTTQAGGAVTDVTVAASGGTYTRASGSWLDDGWRVGRHAVWAGFANSGNNGSKTITGLTATVMTVSETLTDEASGASVFASDGDGGSLFWRAVGCDAATQTEVVTTVAPAVGALTSLRIRRLSGNVWEFDAYDYTNERWKLLASITLGSGLSLTTNLIAAVQLIQLGTNARAISVMAIDHL